MPDLKHIRLMTLYKAWANEITFSTVARLPAEEATRQRATRFGNIVHTLNHVYVIDRVFQAHLTGQRHGYTARNTPSPPPLTELHANVREMDRWYVDFAAKLTPTDLARSIRFEFIGGGDGIMTSAEMMLHVVNHGTYHRGFVGDMMYQAGVTPEATDLPVFIRDTRSLR